MQPLELVNDAPAEVIDIKTSSETEQLFGAMVTAQALIQKAKADSWNQYHRSWYADMASAVEATRPALSEAGLAVMQFPATRTGSVTRSYREETQNGEGQKVTRPVYFSDNTPMMETVPVVFVTIRTRVIHVSGQWIESVLEIPVSMGNRPAQAIGSVITYGRRYAWMSILGVASDEDDDDGNGASGLEGYEAGRKGAPSKQADLSGAKTAHSAQARRSANQPKRPQGIEGKITAHLERFKHAQNVNVLRTMYEQVGIELDSQLNDDQRARIKAAKNERRDQLLAMQPAPDAEREIQQAPPIEDDDQDEMIDPGLKDFDLKL